MDYEDESAVDDVDRDEKLREGAMLLEQALRKKRDDRSSSSWGSREKVLRSEPQVDRSHSNSSSDVTSPFFPSFSRFSLSDGL